MPRKITLKEMRSPRPVASKDGTAAVEEGLPYPMVLYPGMYGTFMAFMEHGDSPVYVCTCARTAAHHYVRLRMSAPAPTVDTPMSGAAADDPAEAYVLDPRAFPRRLVEDLLARKVASGPEVLRHLRFRKGLCHRCNRRVPAFRYCASRYGSLFRQSMGWYVNQKGYEYGVEPVSNRVLTEVAPPLIERLVVHDPAEVEERVLDLWNINREMAEKLRAEYEAQCAAIWYIIEDDVREGFGHRRLGDRWAKESELSRLVTELYPGKKVRRHYRPGFLDGLELDIYVEDERLGIEYQGIQHYQPMEHWGGEEGLEELQVRDGRKKALCEAWGVRLVEFRHDEEINEDVVKERLL